ncbi:hypothetical protein B0G62_115104 [Paraburkholderia eburnea]|uniref:Uncharacterized protein n=1 Tax=Paraburkholderia eburnea TaxID=1189126 RepID=A0A2S4M0H3_9BURK|nr:hypothetical protein [Paraburkholderia eburnea]POR48221.1 hypothetical protein B0G62_115104 [Paraburkholderia eburnea]PRZ22196.1 hypothetical protein BX588_10734 [Paraburkholderia eburnea]
MPWNTLDVPLDAGWKCTLIPGAEYYDMTGWGRGYRDMSARALYPNAGRDNSFSWNARPLSEVDKGELWEKDRLRQLADDTMAFARHFRPNWDLRTITGEKALRDVQAFVRDSLSLAHWNLPTDNAGVRRLLCDAVAAGKLVPVVNREYYGLPRVAQSDPVPQRWPATGGGGNGYPPRVLSYSEFDALRRANGELPALDSGGVSAALDPLPALGAAARADDGFGLLGAVESAAAALLGGGDDSDESDDAGGDDGGVSDADVFSGDSTPLGDAQPFDYSPNDAPDGDSFDIAKTPNEGDPGTWYTNPGSGQMRMYGDDGQPVVDFDFDHDHGQGVPHAHNWDNGVRGPGVAFSPL